MELVIQFQYMYYKTITETMINQLSAVWPVYGLVLTSQKPVQTGQDQLCYLLTWKNIRAFNTHKNKVEQDYIVEGMR